MGISFLKRICSRFLNNKLLVSEAFDRKISLLYSQAKVNSYYRVISSKKAILEFGGSNLSFKSITPEWLMSCEENWRSIGYSSATINIYMKALKAEFNELVRNGVINQKNNPFGRGRYSIPTSPSRQMALTKEQIRILSSYSGNSSLEYYRDLWIFSFLCNGINFRDMIFLKGSNIRNEEIVFFRSKTRHSQSTPKEIHAVFLPEMKNILTRWGNYPNVGNDTYLFKMPRKNMTAFEEDTLVRGITSMCNSKLHILSSILGLPSFSTYSARHSFATILNQNGVSVSYISESLGHSNVAITQAYLDGFTADDRKKYSKILV